MKFRQGDTTQVLIEFDQSLGELDLKVGIYRLDTDAIAVESLLSDEGSLIEYIGNNAYSMVIPHSVTVGWVGKYYLDILVKSPNDTSFVNSCEKPIRFTFGAAKISTNLANPTESETPDAEFSSSGMPNEDYNLHATVTISQPSLNIAGEQYPTLTAMVSFGNWFKGQDGKDAKINGYNTIEIVEGEGIEIEQEEGTLTINSKHSYQYIRRLGEYLYEMTFATLPEYVPSNALPVGGCTSFVRDGKLYRNLDWKYDETPSFLIRTKDFDGVAFDNSVNDGNMRDAVLGQLPYRIVDGVNRHGIMGSVHVLYNDFDWHGNGSIPLTKALYEILTRVTSMQSIQSELSPIIGDLATTPALDAAEYLLQFVITDGLTTYVLTPTSGGYELVNITANPKLTNFKWVNKPTLQRNDSALQLRPTGVERWNLIGDGEELSDFRFTKAYETPDRLSEFIGIDETTKSSSDAELTAIYERAHTAYQTRTRDGQLWQTMHSVVYGSNGMEHLWTQENWDVDFAAQGGEFEQVQANWNENDSSSKAYIRNKPTIPDVSGLATKTELNQGLATKQDVIEDLDEIREGAEYGHTSVQPEDLAPYRTASAQDIIDAGKQPTISDLNAIREGAAAGATAVQPSALNNYATKSELQAVEDEIPSVTDNVTSTSAEDALSAKQGKLLNDRINNIATRGRFLSLWNCTTGLPLTNPSGYPYTYQTGDFFIVNQTGETNYIPSGSTYTGQPSTTVYSGEIKVNDTIFYDGTSWSVFDTPAGSGDVQDVYQNGESVLSGGVAYVVTPNKTSDLTNDSDYQTSTQVQQTVNAHHDDTKVDKVTGKQLSTEDFTSAEKNKLAGITAGAEVNVQSDWNQTNTTADDYIKNKPTIPTQLSQLSGDTTHRTVTDTEKSTWNGKQDTLVSGTNIKTLNNTSLLGTGNIDINGLKPLPMLQDGYHVDIYSIFSGIYAASSWSDVVVFEFGEHTFQFEKTNLFIVSNFNSSYSSDYVYLIITVISSNYEAIEYSTFTRILVEKESGVWRVSSSNANIKDIGSIREADEEINVCSNYGTTTPVGTYNIYEHTYIRYEYDGEYAQSMFLGRGILTIIETSYNTGIWYFIGLYSDRPAFVNCGYGETPSVTFLDSASWGSITGSIEDQEDLQAALDAKLSNHDFAFLSLNDNTTSFNFPANQQCHRKVRIVASATLNFAVDNKACNYVRVYNSGSSEITLTIGTVTHNGTAVTTKVGPAEIKCGVGKYVEISVIYDGSDATFTASDDLQVLN